MDKEQLRNEIRTRKRHFSRQQLKEMSLPSVQCLLQHRKVQVARTILLYSALPDEVDVHLVIERLARNGQCVLLPVVLDNCNMELRRYVSDGDLREGSFHILEPVGNAFPYYDKIDVAVVPGMAFDAHGHRLGRGKGYYDRFLPLCQRAWRIGICFDFQQVADIPADSWDAKMDEVIAGGRILTVR